MIISRVFIDKFRGFQNVEFSLGKFVTIIAGQNGTMKSTLLGMIGQPFSVKDKDNPISEARTIDGSRFTAPFQEKFRLSPKFDLPGNHQWKLIFTGKAEIEKGFFELKSIERRARGSTGKIRFWSTEGRSKGMGYIQIPVIFLSLKRIIPLGEEKRVSITATDMTDSESAFVNSEHRSILSILDEFEKPEMVVSANKHSLGAVTDYYDANSNSAGQDNIGKVLLAVLSFKRLKEQYPNHYKGGILLIDEIDATLFPSAQKKLVRRLFYYASKYDIQIIATSHSLSILEEMFERRSLENGRVVYLRKRDGQVEIFENPTLLQITNDIQIQTGTSDKSGVRKIEVYCEDQEGYDFLRWLIPKDYTERLHLYDNVTISGDNLRTLVVDNRIPHFCQALIVLDGDKENDKKKADNIIYLPGDGKPPEKVFINFLQKLPEKDIFWEDDTLGGYSKQYCLNRLSDVKEENREIYKNWYKSQSPHWGNKSQRLVERWMEANQEAVHGFQESFIKAYNYLVGDEESQDR